MKIPLELTHKILMALAQKHNEPYEGKTFKYLDTKIPGLGNESNYLYRSMFLPCNKGEAELVGLNRDKLNTIAKYLGHETFNILRLNLEKPIEHNLKLLAGLYACYVRRNDDNGVLLRSPVNISEKKGKMIYQLIGGNREFKGEISLKNGNIFATKKI